jgi:hypothetical protein
MRATPSTAVLVAGTIGFLAGTDCSLAASDNPSRQKERPLSLPQGAPEHPQGISALTIRRRSAEPFTKADVATYFTTRDLPMNSAPRSQLHVESLEFLTSKEVAERLHGVSTGLEDNEQVGFAILTGTFAFPGPRNAKPARFSSAYAVFAVATGNLLMDGTLEAGNGDNPKQE